MAPIRIRSYSSTFSRHFFIVKQREVLDALSFGKILTGILGN